MSSKMNWEKAARRDRIRDYGSSPLEFKHTQKEKALKKRRWRPKGTVKVHIPFKPLRKKGGP